MSAETAETNPIFAAVDTPDTAAAEALVGALSEVVGGIKLGLEFFTANGPEGVRTIASRRLPLFLDLKLHDIPNTVAGAVRSVLPLKPALLTVHGSGGPAMLRAAAEAAAEAGADRPDVVAITVLTSLDDEDLDAVGQRPPAEDQVRRLAELSHVCGIDGVVCSPREIATLRADRGPDFRLVVPGIRPAGAAVGDQKRVMTPAEARAAGADVLVIGRPITQASDPADAARAIAAELTR